MKKPHIAVSLIYWKSMIKLLPFTAQNVKLSFKHSALESDAKVEIIFSIGDGKNHNIRLVFL